MKPLMRQATSAGKVAMAVLSLLLTVLIWERGLEDSFSRPSAAPKLSLRQQEIALLAAPALPESIKPFLVGENPENVLREGLKEIPLDEMDDRLKLMLAALEPEIKDRLKTLKASVQDKSLLPIQKSLTERSGDVDPQPFVFSEVAEQNDDPLLYRLACLASGGAENLCVDLSTARSNALKLSFSQGLPAIAVLLGIGLLIRQVWILFRNSGAPWPSLISMPLSTVDMVLLVAGGFVVLGEVFFPALVAPISEIFTKKLDSPLKESLRVFIGYVAMTLPPLLILRQQIKGITDFKEPEGGWLQWKLFPIDEAFAKGSSGWLMAMPLVLLTSWLMNLLVGDQGGSNPLIDLVLRSHDPLSLLLLLATTVILAPLFEELIFRGALLPVLAKSLGRSWGVVVSALVFALAHLSVGEFAPLAVLGLGLALLRLSSGRLFPCVLMHSLWNGLTFGNLLLLG